MTDFKRDHRVIHTDADGPDAIPAVKVMFGTVSLRRGDTVWVCWDMDGSRAHARPHDVSRVRLLSPEEESRRIAGHNALRRDEAIAEVLRRYDAACASNKLLNIRFKE